MAKRSSDSTPLGPSTKYYRDHEKHPEPAVLQEDEDDVAFETLLDKKKRTVRLLTCAREYLQNIDETLEFIVRPVSYTDVFIYLVKLFKAVQSTCKSTSIYPALDIVPGSANKATLDSLREAIFAIGQLMKRIKERAMEIGSPRIHDALFCHWHDMSGILFRLNDKALERKHRVL